MPPALATDDVLTLLQDVAAEVVTPRFRALADDHITEKRPGSLVTIADHEAEAAITAVLNRAYPDAVVLGEEAYEHDPSLMERYQRARHVFTVDPVDGTRNFVEGSPDHALMVAELRDAAIVRSWIWQPEHRVAWVAEQGAGTYRNGERVHLTQIADPLAAQGATSMWSMRNRRLGRLPTMRMSWFSCAIDYPRLIEGEIDFLLYKRGTNPWDHAPGTLMVREAGGSVGHSDGSDYDPRHLRPGIIVARDESVFTTVSADADAAFARRR
ncbi:MAG: inositol monophosphatase [Actinomycetia bacterium]|nr:inositol monophosphatase [Actinomycetes bacterium]